MLKGKFSLRDPKRLEAGKKNTGAIRS